MHGHGIDVFSVVAIAGFGFLIGFGHCLGMCGGIVIAYSTAKIRGGESKARQFLAHLSYGLGRVTTYAALGALVGIAGSVFSITPVLRASVLAFAGALMIVIGLSIAGKLSLPLIAPQDSAVAGSWYSRAFAWMIAAPGFASFYGLGVLNGLLPCGPVYSALAMTLPLASPLAGAGGMAIYGLATIPALLLLGFTVGMTRGFRHRVLFTRLAAISVILFGLYTLFKAGRLIVRSTTAAHEMGGLDRIPGIFG